MNFRSLSRFLSRFLSGPVRACRQGARRTSAWAVRRRGVVAHQFLRGASYGAGTTVVGLAAWWFRARYGG
ncbi:hypothetical protein ACIPUC_16225 [Streptomyces sp. LARHCF249]